MDENCIFCKIINRELPSTIEFEDDDIIVFQNINPVAPIHVLIVPKKHLVNLSEVEDIDKELLGKVLLTAKNVAKQLGIIDAFRVAVANGKMAAQSVFHIHFHLTGGWTEVHDRGEDKA